MVRFGRILLLLAACGLSSAPGVHAQTVVASADGETPGVRLDITEAKRGADDTLTVKFIIVNKSASAFKFGHNLGDQAYGDFGNVGGIHLLDTTNKKKHLVIRDSQKNCVCSSKLKDLPAGNSINLWGKFPAPPASVKAVSIVVPGFMPLDGVAISQ